MKICPNCGTEVERIYCPDCGTKYEEDAVAEGTEFVEEMPEAEETADPEEASYEVRQEIVPVPGTQHEYRQEPVVGKISAKSTGIIAYITWLGLIIALIIGDREGAKFHLNQALVIKLASVILGLAGSWVPVLGALVAVLGGIFTTVCWGIGLYYAVTSQEKEVPLLGQIKLL